MCSEENGSHFNADFAFNSTVVQLLFQGFLHKLLVGFGCCQDNKCGLLLFFLLILFVLSPLRPQRHDERILEGHVTT
ncbi:hypothetical protein F5B22DRAFT_528907 [Xylaria bambusicola]|uniref:uncharacterized protein n=1 Tax=Xylaria bambusicola TaxID=326684 RepID=UPI0020089A5E|nr:uncharacterized protein F5B22DRAFT_528907 [Xylaria bambusicola]KAI0505340.1 hypothetical protein F5B22DRAFT_528907 [Xylaria bambusicola]